MLAWFRVLSSLLTVLTLLASLMSGAARPLLSRRDPQATERAAWLRDTWPTPPDPVRAAPEQVSRFFDGLPEAERIALARRYPDIVGNLDGAPIPLRMLATRIAIAAAARQAPAAEAARYASWLATGRQFLAFDPVHGYVAEVVGDLATARRVVVVVPGSGIDLADFDDARHGYSAPLGMARALVAAAGPGLAVIVWVGYRAPKLPGVAAARAELARAGAASLARFVHGLAVAGRPVSVLFCHSYGSVVCALAARDVHVTDLVVYGSPGMRARSVAALGTPAHVWAARSAGDWIEWVPHVTFLGFGHGPDPVDPAFGARVINASGAHGHGGYFVPGTVSLRNFALIALGRYADVTCMPGAACLAGLAHAPTAGHATIRPKPGRRAWSQNLRPGR